MNSIVPIITALTAFITTALLGFVVIPYLKKLKYGQTILDEGPKWHKSKEGTPTMGGVMIIAGVIIALLVGIIISVISQNSFYKEFAVGVKTTSLIAGLLFALMCGAIGLMDDYIKVVKKRNLGLTAKQKTFLQLLVCAAYLTSMYLGGMTFTRIPFIGTVDITSGIGLLFWPIALVFIYGFTNAVNLTDGVDGLASSVTIVAAIFFAVISVLSSVNNALCGYLSVVFAAALFGFLIWNKHPAKVFMGDTGSMFLGGMVVGLIFMLEYPILLMLIGIVYLCEAMSVVIQVAYFKKTKKRLFKMSPIHHHYELSGWGEVKIDLIFSLVGAIGGLVSMALIVFG